MPITSWLRHFVWATRTCSRASRSIHFRVMCRHARVLRPIRSLPRPIRSFIVSPKSHGFLNSCYANEKHKIKGQGEQFVMISPKDAAARSIREGDPVRVYNDHGDFEGLARISDDAREGVIVATLGYWRSLNRSDGSVNSISSAEFCGLGRAPTFSDNLVQVVRASIDAGAHRY